MVGPHGAGIGHRIVTDIFETQKSQYSETALLSSYCYNSIEKRRSYLFTALVFR